MESDLLALPVVDGSHERVIGIVNARRRLEHLSSPRARHAQTTGRRHRQHDRAEKKQRASAILAGSRRLFVVAVSTAQGALPQYCFPRPRPPRKARQSEFIYQFGHPFEHQLFDALQPDKVIVIEPDGKVVEL